jgi:sulfite exporter TauE/SafE
VSFGFQLGVGLATIVTTALVYAALAGAVLTSSLAGGTVVMGAFGLGRGLALLPAARITTPSALFATDAWLARRRVLAGRLAVTAAAVAAGCLSLSTL